MVELATFIQDIYRDTDEWRAVDAIARRLLVDLSLPASIELLASANRPGVSSAEVQATFRGPAEALGSQTERKGLFSTSIAGLRPDYFLRLGETGILLEVERGKTTTNNMDLLDFWKCHICGVAAYLFLLVPIALQHNHSMAPKKELASVKRRLGQFFERGNYTNVRGLCLFGY